MALYICNCPSGLRLVNAHTPVAALLHAMGQDGYTAEALSAPQLAQWVAKGLVIENAPEPMKRAAKTAA